MYSPKYNIVVGQWGWQQFCCGFIILLEDCFQRLREKDIQTDRDSDFLELQYSIVNERKNKYDQEILIIFFLLQIFKKAVDISRPIFNQYSFFFLLMKSWSFKCLEF